ncbi:MAG: hypothetical protein IJM87_05115 [Ruminococcus sp.]|nr:hypothetical protein [Ruminococcus sp.]
MDKAVHNIYNVIRISHDPAKSIAVQGIMSGKGTPGNVAEEYLKKYSSALELNFYDLPLQVGVLRTLVDSLENILSDEQRGAYKAMLSATQSTTVDMKELMKQRREEENDH